MRFAVCQYLYDKFSKYFFEKYSDYELKWAEDFERIFLGIKRKEVLFRTLAVRKTVLFMF